MADVLGYEKLVLMLSHRSPAVGITLPPSQGVPNHLAGPINRCCDGGKLRPHSMHSQTLHVAVDVHPFYSVLQSHPVAARIQ